MSRTLGEDAGKPVPAPSVPGPQDLVRALRLALGLAFRSSPWVLACHLAVTLLSATAPVVVTWLVKDILDTLTSGASAADIAAPTSTLAAVSTIAAVAPQFTGYLRARMMRVTSLRAHERLHARVDTFTGLRRFEHPEFLDQLRLAQQAGGLAPSQVVDGAAGLIRSTVLLTGFVGSLAILDPFLAVAVSLSGIPVLWAEITLSRRRARTFWDISPSERREIFYATLLTSVEAAKEIRLYGAGGFLRGRMLSERRAADALRERQDRSELRIQSALQTAAAVLAGASLLWAVGAASRGAMTVGDVSMLLAAIPAVQSGIGGLAGELGQTHHSLVMFDHYVTVLRLGPDLPAPHRPRPAGPLREGIEIQDLWFRYEEELPWVLRGVNLRIERGTALALAGVNGSGKSTLVKLLCRFYDPTRGRILWDGTDLRDIAPAELRARIAATFQDPMRYDLTAQENVCIGELSALSDLRRCEEAARLAGMHEEIARLPRGYATLLSRTFRSSEGDGTEMGVQLSGGQWQRMGLARSFLRTGADLLILDEPSSGLDPAAEYEIHARLRERRAGRTSVLISHRLGAVKDADVIAVLEDGRVRELGDHRRLIAQGGTYQRLFALQSSGYRDEPAEPEGARP
ncbi:ABC transporter ATP-binding protein [Streptomyces sp. NRRL B-3648]|uniref:ABC transporter ATP-binding protein n=1 Tax=Streptomyces sp. NRRL B-3648 TaxID=1519493 RepID=UPI00099B3BAE|nr:ABC transporter ATP-binding protein [Streptomyces sp. NRRL B-3648]